MLLYNDTQKTEEITSLQSAINDTFLSDIKGTEGVSEVHAVKGVPVVFPYEKAHFSDFWIKGYTELKPYLSYSETVSLYQQNPEKYYGMIKGIDESEFDYLNGTLGNVIDKQEFLNGETAILQYAGFEIPNKWIGRFVLFVVENQMREIKIGAVNYGDY